MNSVLLLLSSLAISLLLTAAARVFATQYGFVARPQNDRWHKAPTALLGGVGMLVAFGVPLLFFAKPNPELQLLLLGSFLIFGIGLVDDIVHLQPYTKLIGQIVVACIFIACGQYFGIFGWSLPVLFLSLLWIVGVTNAFNLLDNMDGLAAGTACIAAFCLMLAGMITGNALIILVCAGLIGATLGFLWFNFHPAKIFMGDSGSLFLGFTLSTLSLMGQWVNVANVFFALIVPVLVLIVPIFDTAFVSLVRFFNGRPISQGGQDHTSHRLVAFGLSEKMTVLLFYAVSMFCGLIAVMGLKFGWLYPAILSALIAIALIYFGVFLSGIVAYGDTAKRFQVSPSNTILSLFLMEKKRIGEIAIDSFLIAFSLTVAFLIRFDALHAPYYDVIVQSLPLLIPLKLILFFYFGLYRGIWRYMGIQDLLNIVKAVTLSSIMSVVCVVLLFRFENYSRAVFFIDWMVLLITVSGARIAIRALREYCSSLAQGNGVRLLIIGAGDGGEIALREIKNSPTLNYRVVGFIDDDEKKIGCKIHDIPVLGKCRDLENLVQGYNAEEVLIAIPSLSQEKKFGIVRKCHDLNIPIRLFPKLRTFARLTVKEFDIPYIDSTDAAQKRA